jgi:hypothetical protein
VFWWFRSATPLCKSCVHRRFWEYTLLTLVGGWWSFATLVFSPWVIAKNVFQYVVCCFTLQPVPPGAGPPELTPEAMQRLRPFAAKIEACLQKGAKAVQIACRLAPVAGVTPGQVMLFIWRTRSDRQLGVNTGYVIEMPK